MIGEEREFRYNECDVVIASEDVQRAVMKIDFTEATCPHCGKVNVISGFTSVEAFGFRKTEGQDGEGGEESRVVSLIVGLPPGF